jgi:hypothetical protein
MEDQVIRSQASPLVYFHILPNLADEELDPYQYRLFGHYVRVCGAQNKACRESTRVTAKKCQMSHAMVIKTRRQLAELGYIQLHELEVDRQQRVYVTLLDFWPRNITHFANLPKRPKQPSWAELLDAEPGGGGYGITGGGHTVEGGGYGITGGGHTVEGGGYTVEHKNNHQEKPSSKNQKKKNHHHHQTSTTLTQNDDDDDDMPPFLIFGQDETEIQASLKTVTPLALDIMDDMGWLGAQTYLENLPKRQLKPLLEWLWFWDYLYGPHADIRALSQVSMNPFHGVQNAVGKVIKQMALGNALTLTESMQFALKATIKQWESETEEG